MIICGKSIEDDRMIALHIEKGNLSQIELIRYWHDMLWFNFLIYLTVDFNLAINVQRCLIPRIRIRDRKIILGLK